MRLPTLWRASLNHLLRHPWQLALSVLGIALGVAVVVAIDLAIGSAHRAFTLSTEAVTGRATHQVTGGPAGLPDAVYRRLRVELGLDSVAPVVEGYVTGPVGDTRTGPVGDPRGGREGKRPTQPVRPIRATGPARPAAPGLATAPSSTTAPAERTFHLFGVDPFAEGEFRPYLASPGARVVDFSALLTLPGAVLLSAVTAREAGLAAGDSFTVRSSGRGHTLVVIGLLDPADESSRRALENLLLADISTAQEVLGELGRLDRIDLIVPEGEPGAARLRAIESALPPGAVLEHAAARTDATRQMTRAFSLNLEALGLLTLVFGMFLIYNSTTFSVVQRRALLGRLRALGVTRREVFALVMGEALGIGLVGSALGLAAGMVLGQGLVRLVTTTINDLYFVLNVRQFSVPVLALVRAGLLGVGATVLAAALPAWEATAAAPRAALVRSGLEDKVRRAAVPAAATGAIVVLAGCGLLVAPSRSVIVGFAGLFAGLFGAALLIPAATLLLMRAARPAAGVLLGVLGRMAVGNVTASLSRTAPAIAALAIALSVVVAVGIMIGSFRSTVVHWLETTLEADVYVSVPGGGRGVDGALDPDLAARLAGAPGVAGVSTYRRATVASPLGRTPIVALDMDPRHRAAFRFKDMEEVTRVWAGFDAGALLVSEPFAYRHGLRAADTVQLATGRGLHAFPVAGVFYDYSSERGVVFLDRATYDALWDDPSISSLALFAAGGMDADVLVQSLRQVTGGQQRVLIRSNRGLREASLAVFDRTFTITRVLRVLTLVVALVGVLSALLALELERTRELGVLRATGMTPGQVWRLVSYQSALIGAVAGAIAIPLGLALAAAMVFVINKRSFGWTLQMETDPMILLQAVALALGAALLAGIYPALRMARTRPALALREE